VKLGNRQLVEKLTRSAIYRDYVRAISAATGMPLALRAVEHWQPALRGQKMDDAIGAMAGSSSPNHVRKHYAVEFLLSGSGMARRRYKGIPLSADRFNGAR
jgi:hypothetical protein